MRKFDFTIRGNKYNVEIKDFELNIVDIEVNGTPYKVEIHKEVSQTKTPKLVRPVVQKEGSGKIKKKLGSTYAIKAPLPGIILKIMLNVGTEVKKGDNLMVMEAMKMENSILSEKDGTIKSVKVNVGDNVLQGDVLIEIE
ncbi:MAG: acetyl-CoA carboxylase biotin carboxyl carrier protein subunit [Chlorobi bacterium]|nr:acetyl-CoA carboxylase biotin carboxyl carrier protein subunit [Chlorobiota bacterium]